jgi:hypothetical protein
MLLVLLLQFRLVAVHDFAKNMTWPELVPPFQAAVQSSDLVNAAANSELRG